METNSIKEVKLEYIKPNRKVTLTNKWKTCLDIRKEMNSNQNELSLHSNLQNKNMDELIKNQIQQKIQGYRWQDIIKKLYYPEKFIDYDFVIELLQTCQKKCFYCQENVQIIYTLVREPKQWTIERIDNTMGHNKDNVEISCLRCNLQRRTMNYKCFLTTKQLKIHKMN